MTDMKNERGSIKIANAVLAKLAGYAASNCYGVVGMATRSGKDGIAKLLRKENMDRGVKIKTDGTSLEITIFIIVEYGININTIGESIKNNVKYQIEQMTGLEVKRVMVNVESVRVDTQV